MGWQVRSSGGKYGSRTGHALLIGAESKKVLDSVVYNKKCTICAKQERRGVIDRQSHRCLKNFDGSSKSMEAAGLVAMLKRMPEQKSASVCIIISDDDSNARAKAQHICNGGSLPESIEEPRFLADPSHRKRVFARHIYNLANAPVKTSKVSKSLASHLKYCYGACIKRYRHLTAEELSIKVYNILDHICGYHANCDESLCYEKAAEKKELVYVPPRDHRIQKEDSKTYDQLLSIFHQYANVTQMEYCNHPYDTQTNEALNQVIATVAPKNVCYSGSISLMSRIAIVIGIHNYGHSNFFDRIFRQLGIMMTTTLERFLNQKEYRKEYKKNMMNG